MLCRCNIVGLVNYEGSTWLKANNSHQVVVFLERGNIILSLTLCLICPHSSPLAGEGRGLRKLKHWTIRTGAPGALA
jgi:hypothetical protein